MAPERTSIRIMLLQACPCYYRVGSNEFGGRRLREVTTGADVGLEYAYDELGRVTNRAIDGVSSSVAFDAVGRVMNVSNVLGTFANTYLSNTFRLSSIAYPNGQSTTFNYFGHDQDNRLQQITHSITNSPLSTFQYTYDPDGQIATWTQQAGAATPKVWGLDYDPVDQLLGATIHSNSITGAILKSYFYGYDSVGNRLAEQIDSGVTAGNFNALNQLTNMINGGRVRFAGQLTNKPGNVLIGTNPAVMDLQRTRFVGFAEMVMGTNIVTITATDFAGHSSTNRYQIVVTNNAVARTLTYDANGNLTNVASGSRSTSYAWDGADRLLTITQSGDGTNLTSSYFEYDGLGRRVRILDLTNNTTLSDKRFVWVGTELAEERDAAGSVIKRFFGGGEQIGGANYFLTCDHLGSVQEMTDATGAVVARYEYDPYGRRTRTEGTMEADFGFTGHYYHAPSGVHLALYRVYDTETGRWMSRDPIQERDGLNLYGYVQADPVNREDPTGLQSWIGPGYGALPIPQNMVPPMLASVKTYPTEILTAGILNGAYENLYRRLNSESGPGFEGWFDTRFWTGENEQYWSYNGRLFRGNDINYMGIGMYEAWKGSTREQAECLTKRWKALVYRQRPSEDVLYWLDNGYHQYRQMAYERSPFPYLGSSRNAPPRLVSGQ